MFSIIPFPVKIMVLLMLISGALGFGYMKGSEQGKLAIASLEAKSQEQIAELEKKNSEISNKVVTQYVDKIHTVKEKEYVYVDAAKNSVPAQSDMSNGWVYLHDVSASGGDADASRSSDATSSGIKDNEALITIIGNYSRCNQNASQLTALQSWIEENKKAIDESNAKKAETKKKRFGVF